MTLSDNHSRHLLATLAEVDGLLTDVEALLSSGRTDLPLSRYVRDATPVQRKVTADLVAQLREQMGSLLSALGVAPPRPTTGCVWAVRTRLMKIETLLADLQPTSLRGYGELDADTESALRGQAAVLERTLRRLSDYLAEGPGQGFGDRLARLERAGGETRLLQTIEAIATRHGLIELRPAIAHLVERLESPPCFEIAFFGRVSSGKSALLNRILGRDILPVGVTPVTALPTRIAHGEPVSVAVAFADRPATTVDVACLEEFVAEQGNPGNAKHVVEVVVRLPSLRLSEGIVLVDTPGVGSLASSGADEARAYLPRCDLGILLIDAGSTLTQDDLRLLHLLHVSAIPAMVLVSKCDLLAPQDVERTVRYIGDTLAAELGEAVPVQAVSALASKAGTVDDWFEQQIRPLYQGYRELARASTWRKIGHLRGRVTAALRRAAAAPSQSEEWLSEPAAARVEARLAEADRQVESARQRCQAVLDALRGSQERLVEVAVRAIASLPPGASRAGAADRLAGAVHEEVAARGRAVYGEVRRLRGFLQQTLHELSSEIPVRSPPVDLETEVPLTDLPAPERIVPSALGAGLGSPWRGAWRGALWRRWAQRRVASALDGGLREGLVLHAGALRAWSTSRLEHLAQAYDAAVADCRNWLRQRSASGVPDASVEEAVRDLRALEEIPCATRRDEEAAGSCPS